MTHVVLVEDNDELRALTAEFLRSQGCQVLALESAEEITAVAGVPQLFIIDLNLPGVSGYSLIRSLREASSTVGIIIVSARDRSDDVRRGYERGADVYLTKPVDPDVLLAALQRLQLRVMPQSGAGPRHVVDVTAGTLTSGDTLVALGESEIRLLYQLQMAGDQGLARWELAEILGLDLEQGAASVLERRISRLRRKLVQAGLKRTAISALRNVGYVLGPRFRFRF